MKKILCAFAALTLSIACFAQVNITKVDKVKPNDEMFMDMAVQAAKKSVADGKAANGAVVILNGAWRSTGLPTATETPEENAISKSRRNSLSGATIYTVNAPTSKAINAINASGADAVYFVNPSADVVAAGIYTDADYNPELIVETDNPVPVFQIYYAPAVELLKK